MRPFTAVYTDRMYFKMCIDCAFKAQKLGIAVEVLPNTCNPDHRSGNTQLDGLADPCDLREDHSTGKRLEQMKLTSFGRMLIAYTLATAALFAALTAMFGLKATLWGFAILYFSCTLGVLAVWWQEQRQWSRPATWSKDPRAGTSAHVISLAADPAGQLSSKP